MYGAGDGNRTRDLLITNQLLYRLSYTSQRLSIIDGYLTLEKHFLNFLNASIIITKTATEHNF